MISVKHFFLIKLYLELEKLSKEKEKKIGEKHGISYTDVLKTYATSFKIKKNSFAVSNPPKCIELS